MQKKHALQALVFTASLAGLSFAGVGAANASTLPGIPDLPDLPVLSSLPLPSLPSSSSTKDDGILWPLVKDNGPVDGTVGDKVVEPLLGDDGALGKVVKGTKNTPLHSVTESLVGTHSAAKDVPGDGAVVEGGLVGDAAKDVDGVLIAASRNGDVPKALSVVVTDAGVNVSKTLYDTQTDSIQLIGLGGVVPDAVNDLTKVVHSILVDRDSASAGAATQALLTRLLGNVADAVDDTSLTDDVLADVLGDTDGGSNGGGDNGGHNGGGDNGGGNGNGNGAGGNGAGGNGGSSGSAGLPGAAGGNGGLSSLPGTDGNPCVITAGPSGAVTSGSDGSAMLTAGLALSTLALGSILLLRRKPVKHSA